MNYSAIRKILGNVLEFEALFLLLPCIVALIYREHQGIWYLACAAVCLVIGRIMASLPARRDVFYAREGFVAVALSWIVLSIFGAAPFVLCGDIPSFTDALFETISGFTTTGSSILTDVEALSRTSLFWRSFTHWVGGMGVIVFILAVMPKTGGYNMHLMRAESPGPSVGKLVPKIRETAMTLYMIYFGITVVELLLLIIARMPVFDAFCIAFGSAGTGGFGVLADSCASYSLLCQGIITVFIILFGVNFNAYYFLLMSKDKKAAFQMTEVRAYFGIIAFCIITIGINIRGQFENIFLAFHHAAFQVGSVITTTGFATQDFNLWPQYSRALLVLIMFIGACAGSTGGGMKVSRVLILFKVIGREIERYIHPRSVRSIKMDGKACDPEMVRGVCTYLGTYMMVFALSVLSLTMIESCDLETIFTSVAATFSNIGPGLNMVGPSANFAFFSPVSKYILMFDMLAGRLELYPMLLLFAPGIWRKS